MRGAAQTRVFHRLDRLPRSTGGVVNRLRHVQGTAHRAGGVDAGATRLVREADEVRVVEAVLENRDVLALAIDQVQHRLLAGSPLARLVLRYLLDVNTPIRDLTGGEHHEIGLGDRVR